MELRSDRPFVKLLIPGALVSTLRLLEHGAEWHRHLLDIILTPFIVFSCIYLLYSGWGELIAQYRPRELFRDRVLTFQDVLMIGTAGTSFPLMFVGAPEQIWMGSWDQVLRVVIALLIVILAIPEVVQIVRKTRRLWLGRPQNKIG